MTACDSQSIGEGIDDAIRVYIQFPEYCLNFNSYTIFIDDSGGGCVWSSGRQAGECQATW